MELKMSSDFEPLDAQKIEELKSLLEKYDCKDELEDIEDLEEWEQIEQLKELLEEYKTQENEDEQIEKLKSLVIEYKHHHSLPPLPEKPHGSLFGIGFIYDEDMDTRVLMAIEMLFEFEMLKGVKNIVAVHEHEGTLAIYSKNPCGYSEIEVCGDNWSVYNFLSRNGEWIEIK